MRRRAVAVALACASALLSGACASTDLRMAAPPLEHPAGGLEVGDLVLPAAAPPETVATRPPGDAAIAPPPASFVGAAPRRRPAPPVLEEAGAPGPGVWAVIVGVNDYPGTEHDLRSAVADAEDLDLALAGFGVPNDHRLVLRDGQVTRAVLRSAATWLSRRAGPDAIAVFFFAGHVRKVSATTEAMVTADGSLVTDADLARDLAGLKARQAWIVMAACYGGGFTEVVRPGRVLTAAAGADDIAYENLAFKRSYLVQYMVRQGFIEGRATESVQAAFTYARETIARDFPDRVPEQYDQAGAAVDLRQAGYQAPAPSPPPPQQQQAAKPEDRAGTGDSSGTSGGDDAKGGSGGGSSGSGTSSNGSSTTTTTTRDCRILVLRC